MRNERRVLAILAVIALAVGLFAAGAVLALGNKPGETTATMGGGKVTVTYTGPAANSRDVLSLIQPGSYWRMGADRPTTLTTEVDLMFGNHKVAKGKYTLVAHFTEKGEWELVIAEGTGSGWAPQGEVGRVAGKISKIDSAVENMTIKLEAEGSKGKLVLDWGTARLIAEFDAA